MRVYSKKVMRACVPTTFLLDDLTETYEKEKGGNTRGIPTLGIKRYAPMVGTPPQEGAATMNECAV
jgi:hypothetical protein